jgi:hypothetical protein
MRLAQTPQGFPYPPQSADRGSASETDERRIDLEGLRPEGRAAKRPLVRPAVGVGPGSFWRMDGHGAATAPGQVANAPARLGGWRRVGKTRRSARTRPNHRFEPHHSEGDKSTTR